ISGHLAAAHDAYRRWFGDDYDLTALDCVLAAAAAERLDGDPAWLLVVSGSGAAKTETITPLAAAGAVVVSSINGEAALLSGTSARERAQDATGGLLRRIGERGLLVIKDVTSILSMNRDTRATVLAALREIYDGHWTCHVGTDGGQTLSWRGRLVVIGAVTTVWDRHYQVVSTMGDRFVLVRIASDENRRAAGRQALRNVSREAAMRAEHADVVGRLLASVDPSTDVDLTDDEMDTLLDLADVVTRARTPVERDRSGAPLFAHALEMPTRFAKQLAQIARGGLALGMPRERAMDVAVRAAGDTMPPVRRDVLGAIVDHPMSRIADVARRANVPRSSVRRTLDDLHLLGFLDVEEDPTGAGDACLYSLAEGIDDQAVRTLVTAEADRRCQEGSRGRDRRCQEGSKR